MRREGGGAFFTEGEGKRIFISTVNIPRAKRGGLLTSSAITRDE